MWSEALIMLTSILFIACSMSSVDQYDYSALAVVKECKHDYPLNEKEPTYLEFRQYLIDKEKRANEKFSNK